MMSKIAMIATAISGASAIATDHSAEANYEACQAVPECRDGMALLKKSPAAAHQPLRMRFDSKSDYSCENLLAFGKSLSELYMKNDPSFKGIDMCHGTYPHSEKFQAACAATCK